MAKKKRLDKKRDKSSSQRVAGYGRAALAVGVGVALFGRTRLDKNLLSEIAPAAIKTGKNFRKELLNKKATASNIYDAYQKTVGKSGKVFKDTLEAQKNKKLHIRTDKATNVFGRYRSVDHYTRNKFYNDLDKEVIQKIKGKAAEDLKQHFGDKYTLDELKQIVDGAEKNIDVIRYSKHKNNGKPTVDFLSDTIKAMGMDQDDAEFILNTVDSSLKKNNIDAVRKITYNKNAKLSQQLNKLAKEEINKNTRKNQTINKIGAVFGIEDLDDKFLGSHAMTLGELQKAMKDNPDLFDQQLSELNVNIVDRGLGKNVKVNSVDELFKLNKDGSLDDLVVDSRWRVRNNKDGSLDIFDISETMEFLDDYKRKFDSSIIGKILTKGIDRTSIKQLPEIRFHHSWVKSTLSQFDEEAKEDHFSRKARLSFGGKLYDINENAQGVAELGEVLAEGTAIDMGRGFIPGVIERWLGTGRTEPLATRNRLFEMLDLNQDGKSNFMKRFSQFFTKFGDPEWGRNVLERQQGIILGDEQIEGTVAKLVNELGVDEGEAVRMIHEDHALINRLFRTRASADAVTDDTLQALSEVVDDLINYAQQNGQNVSEHLYKTQDLLSFMINNDTEGMFEYLTDDTTDLVSDGLIHLKNSYLKDPSGTLNKLSIETTKTKKIPIVDIELAETYVGDISALLRTEGLKEILSDDDLTGALLMGTSQNIGGQQVHALQNLFYWQKFENATLANRNFDSQVSSLFMNGSSLDNFYQDLDNNPNIQLGMLSVIEEMKADFGILSKGNYGNPNEVYTSAFDQYEFIPKSKIGMDLIRDLNWDTLKGAIKEFNGGGDNLENVSMVSVVSQYMINRLSMGVEDSGLGLSSKSLTSPLASMKNIFMKRVLPVMVAYTAFDYINDLSQDLTGVGITGAAANTLANLDIGARKALYGIGVGDFNVGQIIDDFKTTSVIGEYWTGSTDFQTAEERREWYADGYSPVRKSRFWSFGSSSEFRGGDITFFQPNYLRRAHSDYRDEWLYGGNKEKWAHSIIPTPTHPFSTIRYLMDPYWLEKKHMDDAPTPLTGKMFAEGTPWGAVLNPTVGELIKPQIMLPEVKKRLTGKGRDIKTVLKNINERTKNRKADYTNDDLLVINGTDIRNATYIPYGQPSPNELIVTGGNVKGMDYLNRLSTIDNYAVPTYVPEEQASFIALPSGGYNAKGDAIQVDVTSNKFTKAIARGVNSILGEVYKENNEKGKNLISKINAAIIEKETLGTSVFSSSPDSTSQGTYVYNNLINEYNTRMANYYDEKAIPGMINRSIATDHLKDIGHSAKNLSGIHGFLFDTFFGDNSVTYRWENAGSYQSFSGRFWDAGLGGLGGGPMEIARRFFPSSDKSRVDYNPLRNNVADWLPDYLQVGNPFSKLTKGEMRLPGKGYESLNELHPDEYATDGYGAFDRFKILADVAPNSQEYKIWHNIVKHQITDPELRKEIEEIEARTKRMRGSHEFYEYQYLHTDTKYETGVVKEIRKDKVILVNNQVLSLAGIKFNENYGGELSELIKPGEKIQYRTTDEAINDLENGVVRNAAIYKGADTINKQLMDMGVADRDKMDTSAIGQLATVTARQEFWGAAQELIAHARIPILHNKLMHIETALESFESEQIYGANLQTWDHPIETVLKPMMNEAMGQSMLKRAAVVAYGRYHFGNVLKNSTSTLGRFGSGFVMATLDPAAMLGGTANWIWHALNNGRVGRGNDAMGAFSKGAQVGSAIGTMAWGYANADNPLKASVSFALGAVDLYEKLDLGEFAARFGRKLDWKGAAAIGVGIGLTISALKNPGFDKDKMFGEWQPKKFKEKVKLDEYFDRLEYIKYSGLYNVASRKAMIHEKVNIRHIFKEMDKNKERIGKLTKERQKLLNKYNEGDSRYIAKAAKIDEEIAALTQRGNQMFVGGKYTKAAIAYKKAMESTIYGLSENATKDEILAAVPDQYKDYFQSFMDVKDEDERKKILKKVPEYLRRPLQAAWGMELSDVQSNKKYFKSHKLPNFAWRGWKPNINLKHVKMKTIENEGMLLSDFGFYESEKAKEAYEIAPDIDNYDSRSISFSSTLRLKAELKGMGVNLSNVTIEKTSTPGFWMTADIKQSIGDRMEYGGHSIAGAMQSLTANFI